MAWEDLVRFYREHQTLFHYYLVGSVVAPCLEVAHWTYILTLEWFLKGNIYRANLKKIEPPGGSNLRLWRKSDLGVLVEPPGLGAKIWKGLRVLAWEAWLSWIGALYVVVVFLGDILIFVREVLSDSAPDVLRKLRYPLGHNPRLSSEAVWAHSFAISILFGEPVQDGSAILDSLARVQENHPDFDRRKALEILGDLGIARESVVSRALDNLGPAPTNTP